MSMIERIKALFGHSCRECEAKNKLLHELQIKKHTCSRAMSHTSKQLELLRRNHPQIWQDYFSKNRKFFPPEQAWPEDSETPTCRAEG